MSTIIFGSTIDLLTTGTPSSGGYIVAYDTDGILKQKDEFGVITEIGGGPTAGISATPSLYDVLLVNNDSVSQNIIMGTSTSILSSNGGGRLYLDYGGASSSILLSSDGTTNNSGLYIDQNGNQTRLFSNGFSQTFEFSGDDISIYNTSGGHISFGIDSVYPTTSAKVDDFKIVNNISSTQSTGNNNKQGVFISSRNSTISNGISNVVIIGGQNISATQSNYVYIGGNLNINNAYTLPNVAGTDGQYLVSDSNGNLYWTSGSLGLEEVLGVNNNSGVYDIVMGTDKAILSENGGGQLDLDYNGNANNVLLSTDNGSLNSSYIQLDGNDVTISGDDLIIDGDSLNIGITSSSIVVANGQGLVYGFDYSPTFISNSLVSKLYVDTGTSSLWSNFNNYLPLVGGTISGNLLVEGDLTVSGTQTFINTENLYVEDNIITLNATYSGPVVVDSGLEVNLGDGTYSKFIWDASESYWVGGLSGSEKPITLGTGSINWITKWDSINELSTTSSIYDDGSEVTFNAPIVPGSDDVYDIGTSASRWKDLYLGSIIDYKTLIEFKRDGEEVIDFNQNDITLRSNKSIKFESLNEPYDELVNVAAPFTDRYPQMLKIGTRIFMTDYFGNLYEHDEDLILQNTLTLPDSGWFLSYNSSGDRLYIGDYNGGFNTYYIDDISTGGLTLSSTNSTVGTFRDSISYNSFSDKVYSYDYSVNRFYIYNSDYVLVDPTNDEVEVTDDVPWFNGYVLTTNQQNGKVYIPGSVGPDGVVLIYGSTGSFIQSITYSLESYDFYRTTGVGYDNDRNVALIGVKDFISVINGDTDSEITTIDLSIYGSSVEIQSIYYSNNKIVTSIRDESTDLTYFLIINPDTYAIEDEIFSYSETNSFSDQYIIYDGTNYYVQYDSRLVKYAATKSTKKSYIQAPATQSGDYQHLLQDKSGTLAHIDDIDLPTGKVLWVDATNGNNSTAEAYNRDKPYQTVQAAITDAVSGDLVYVLPGSYTSTVTLKDGVNIHYMNGCISTSTHQDGGVTINCKITGHLKLSSNGVDLTGDGSVLDMEIDEYSGTGSIEFFIGLSGITTTFSLRARKIDHGRTWARFRGNAKVNITIDGDYLRSNATNNIIEYMMDIRDDFTGSLVFKANRIIFPSSGNSGYHLLIATDFLEGSVYIESDELICETPTPAYNTLYSGIIRWSGAPVPTGKATCHYNIKKIRSTCRPLLQTLNVGYDSETIIIENTDFEIDETTTLTAPDQEYILRHGRSNTNLILKNCKLKRNSNGQDRNYLIGFGQQNSIISSYFNNQTDNFNVTFKDCQIIKESGASASGGDGLSLIYLDGPNSKFTFINTEIVGKGLTSGTPYCFDAENVSDGNVYFKNVNSNLDNSTNITDTALVSGFIGNDTNLNII